MAKRTLFPRFRCRECPHLLCIGSQLTGTYYCDGFPKNRKPKRFPRSGPTYPKAWCPRLISPPICRIYTLKDEQAQLMDYVLREVWNKHPTQFIGAERRRYELQCTVELRMTAKQFFEAVEVESLQNVIQNVEFRGSEVVEIDDGLRPYRFYIYSNALIIPAYDFHWQTPEAK